MSLTYGGTTYRSLEEQVRKNMEDISTEADSLAALTDKVDNLKTGGTKVSLTFPAGASSGTVTDEQLATLQKNDENYIEMVNDKELYYLNDPGHEEGFLTYSHVGIENSEATIKTLTITVSAKSFVIVTTVVPTESGGGKLYQHRINVTAAFGSSDDTDTGDFSFLIVSSYDMEYTENEFATIFNTYGSSFIALSTIRLPETGAMPYSGLGMVIFSEAAGVLEVIAYYSVNDSVKEYHKTGSGGNVTRLTDTVTEL